jgi:quinol monooxygenase YgiN
VKHHIWFALLLAGSLSIPVFADLQIQDVLVRRQGSSVNVRVDVMNPGAKKQSGPVTIELYVRKDASDSWTLVKTWNDVRSLAAHNRVARDYFDENNALLKQLAQAGTFEARAVVSAPGVAAVESKYSWHDTETGK